MAIGFLLTLIGLERAATTTTDGSTACRVLSILSMLSLLIDLPSAITAALLAAGAALLLTWFFVELYKRQHEEHFVIMALSAAVLACGNLLWLTETTLHRIVPWWAGFLILMIAGERLELTRLRSPKPWVPVLFRLAVIIFIAGLVTSPWEFRLGVRIAGAGMIAIALWLLRYDLAWQSIKQPGLPRFMAASLIAGYFWLAIGGVFLDLVRAFFRRRTALRRHAARCFFRLRFLDDLRPCADHLAVDHPVWRCRFTNFSISMRVCCISPC